MSEVEHAPGTFCWTELMTPDSAAAKKFYEGLLGWTIRDNEIPGGGVYSMISIDDGAVGGMFQMTEEMKQQAVPPHWQVSVSVESADQTATRAKELGGTVVKEPFDVMDVGRMAVIMDPSNATFAIWQPKKHQGFGHSEPRTGTVCWNELLTNDVDASGKFFSSLFGWNPDVQDNGDTKYTVFRRGETMVGGMLSMPPMVPEGTPSHWMVYFQVDNCDDSVARAEELGATEIVPPTDIPSLGRFSLLRDPTGAHFSVFASAK